MWIYIGLIISLFTVVINSYTAYLFLTNKYNTYIRKSTKARNIVLSIYYMAVAVFAGYTIFKNIKKILKKY
jgi:small neutral amino acid transporter SnatA (MarC family)